MPRTRTEALAERAFLRRLGADCHTPVAGHARHAGAIVEMTGVVASLDGATVLRSTASGAMGQAEAVGERLADELLARGARALLDAEARAVTAVAAAKPLAGRVVVVTRPRAQAQAFAVTARGGRRRRAPRADHRHRAPRLLGAARPRARQDRRLPWAVFTSVNGVEMTRRRVEASGAGADAVRGRRLAAIGPATAAALRDLGARRRGRAGGVRGRGPGRAAAAADPARGARAARARGGDPRRARARADARGGPRQRGARLPHAPGHRARGGSSARRSRRAGWTSSPSPARPRCGASARLFAGRACRGFCRGDRRLHRSHHPGHRGGARARGTDRARRSTLSRRWPAPS